MVQIIKSRLKILALETTVTKHKQKGTRQQQQQK